MPYALQFRKAIPVDDPDAYFNECCVNGDKVSDQLLPMIRESYTDIQHNQEDWGWFIWFKDGSTKLAVDVFCHNPATGEFRLFITSQIRGPFFVYKITDTQELYLLKGRTKQALQSWIDNEIVEVLLDKNHDPVGAA